MSAASELFDREAALRHAAENYAAWSKASNQTPKDLNAALAALRLAAVRYADCASIVNRKTKKEFP